MRECTALVPDFGAVAGFVFGLVLLASRAVVCATAQTQVDTKQRNNASHSKCLGDKEGFDCEPIDQIPEGGGQELLSQSGNRIRRPEQPNSSDCEISTRFRQRTSVSYHRDKIHTLSYRLKLNVPSQNSLEVLQQEIESCTRCPRLRDHCRQIALVKRRAYRGWDYWGKPVPSFGDRGARILILGLAPGAHGSNRTGRMFTGDRSGDILYRVLFRAGLASQPTSSSRDDGLELSGVYITASAHCAPPDNKPTPGELRNCRPYLERELEALADVRVVVALGKIAFDTYLDILKSHGSIASRAPFRFGHNRDFDLGPGLPRLLSSYHPSQQNTSTGKLTEKMLLDVFRKAKKLAGI